MPVFALCFCIEAGGTISRWSPMRVIGSFGGVTVAEGTPFARKLLIAGGGVIARGIPIDHEPCKTRQLFALRQYKFGVQWSTFGSGSGQKSLPLRYLLP